MSSTSSIDSVDDTGVVPVVDLVLEEGPVGGMFSPHYRRLSLGLIGLISSFAVDGIAVGTVMPITVAELHGLPFYAWAFSGYLIGSLFGMVTGGDISDRRGPSRALVIGLVAFCAGLVASGLAGSMIVFVLGRLVQGFGGGVAIVAVYVIVARKYPERIRPRVFSSMAAAWVLPSIIGPGIAGWIAEAGSWRWVFLGIPLLVIPMLALMVDQLRGMGPTPDVPPRSGRKRLAAAATIGTATVQYAGQNLVWTSALLAALGAALLVISLPRLLPSGTLRYAGGLPAVITTRGVLAGAFFGAEAFIPLMLQRERGYTAQAAGFALTFAALSWAAGSWYQGRPGLKISRARLVRIGASAVAVGNASLAIPLIPGVPAWLALASWFLAGLGMGLSIASLSVLLFEYSKPEDRGANSAGLQLGDALGSITFVALGGVIFAGVYATHGATAFVVIFLVMGLLAALGAVMAPRISA